MPRKRETAGVTQLGVEVETKLLTKWKQFVKSRGETLRDAVERALARDMHNPPPPPVPPPPPTYPPLPPVPPPTPKAKRKK